MGVALFDRLRARMGRVVVGGGSHIAPAMRRWLWAAASLAGTLWTG